MTPDALITLFGIPKAFDGTVRRAQENALHSWARLPSTKVIVFGDEAGIAEQARAHHVQHEPHLRRTTLGTPLIADTFQRAAELAETPLLAYANFDILLFEDFVEAVNAIRFENFLAAGQRWNMDVPDLIDFNRVSVGSLQEGARQVEALEPPWGSDVFVWTRSIEWDMPPFAVGRPPWDNWLIHAARARHIPVVDITPSVTVIHQNHDYGHIPSRSGPAWAGPETEANLDLVGADELMDLTHATHVLAGGHLKRARGWRYTRARILRLPLTYPAIARPLSLTRSVFRSVKRTLGFPEDEGSTKSYR